MAAVATMTFSQNVFAGDPDLTQYTAIKTMDFSKDTYPKDVEMTLSSTQCGTAWETGNKLQQKIFEVATPEDLKGYLALQGVKGSKGWWLRSTQGGLYSYNAQRSGAVLNLKKDYVVAFNCTQDAGNVITLNNGAGDPDGPFTYEKSEDTKTYYATLTADGQVGFCGNKSKGYISSIVIYAPGTVVIQPTASYTAVNGKSRTVTFSGVNLAYNTDGSDTYTLFKDGAGNNVNKAEVTVDQPTTYYVVSTDGDKKSDVLEFRIEAGEELALATPVASISKMGEGFTRTYSVTCDNKDVLLTPKAKFTYDFTPADGGENENGVEFDGTIEATAAGTYVVTASAEGYTSSTTTIDNTKEYELTKTIDFTKLNAENLSANWKKKAEGGKLPGSASQWQNKYGDVTADEYFYDFSSETASATDIIDGLNVEFNKDGKAPKLYTGFGFMYPIYQMNAEGDDNTDNKVAINSGNISIADGTADQVGVYTYINNYGKNGTKTTVLAGDKTFALYRFSDMLTQVDIYTPKATVVETPVVNSLGDFRTMTSSEDGVAVKVMLNDAKITVNGLKYGTPVVMLEDATGAVDFSDIADAMSLTKDSVSLNGYVYATWTNSGFNKLSLNDDTENSVFEVNDAEIKAMETTVAEVKKPENICRLVSFKNVKLATDENQIIMMTQGDASIELTDQFGLFEEKMLSDLESLDGILLYQAADVEGEAGFYSLIPVVYEYNEDPAVTAKKVEGANVLFLPTADNVAAALEEGWLEGCSTVLNNKKANVDPETDEVISPKTFEGVNVKKGSTAKTFVMYVTGVEKLNVYGASTSSDDRYLSVEAVNLSDDSDSSTGAVKVGKNATGINTIELFDKDAVYEVTVTGLKMGDDGQPMFDTGADVLVYAVKFNPNTVVTGINNIQTAAEQNAAVYSVNGVMVRKAGQSLEGLAKGVYIIGGKKYVKK